MIKDSNFRNVFFEPWVGHFYVNSSPRLLILAHNYPCNEPYAVCANCGNRAEHPHCTQIGSKAWIYEYLNGKGLSWHRRTFDNFLRSYLNKYHFSDEDVKKFWESVAFYNYVQKANSTHTRIGGMKSEDYIYSLDAFKEVLEILKPTYIITWGNVYHRIPIQRIEHTIENNGKAYYYCEITDVTSVKTPIMLKIHHPSMFYSWSKWGKVISEFLKIQI